MSYVLSIMQMVHARFAYMVIEMLTVDAENVMIHALAILIANLGAQTNGTSETAYF